MVFTPLPPGPRAFTGRVYGTSMPNMYAKCTRWAFWLCTSSNVVCKDAHWQTVLLFNRVASFQNCSSSECRCECVYRLMLHVTRTQRKRDFYLLGPQGVMEDRSGAISHGTCATLDKHEILARYSMYVLMSLWTPVCGCPNGFHGPRFLPQIFSARRRAPERIFQSGRGGGMFNLAIAVSVGFLLHQSQTAMAEKVHEMFYPDTMANWPWKRQINPNFEEVKEQSNTWFRGFKAFSPCSQHAFEKCDFGLLSALSYPRASKEHLRTACDLMNLFFLVDEYTDVENASAVREMVDIVMDALRNPHKPRPDGEIVLGEVARQFWELAIQTASPTSQRHFIEAFQEYVDSVVEQAADRDGKTIRTIETYFKNRRQNIGAYPSFVLIELGLELADEVVYHPSIKEFTDCVCDLIIIDNDIGSYNKEQATGDDRHNILTIVMHQLNTDLQGAVDWAARYHERVEKKSLDGIEQLPSFGLVVDEQLKEYIHGIANWPRSNDCWTFESSRYFGSKGREIQKSRIVPLLPKVPNDPTLKREQVVIPLVEI